MKYGASKEKKLGTRYEFYEYATKGYVYEQTEKTTELVCSVCGGRDYDREEYDKRI